MGARENPSHESIKMRLVDEMNNLSEHSSNGLLASLSTASLRLIEPLFDPVWLPEGSVLVQPNTPIADAYFILDGIAAQISTSVQGCIEIGMYGREGMSAPILALSATQTPHQTVMQVAGSSLRISAADLRVALDRCDELRFVLMRYIQVLSIQSAQTILSTGHFKIEERIARWILMRHDRIAGDLLPLTHYGLSLTLGVRRAGVTNAIHVLEGLGCIRANRGCITVRDRGRLEQIAGDSYGAPEAEYRRLIGSPTPDRDTFDAPRTPMASQARLEAVNGAFQ